MVAAEVFSYEEGLKLIRERGRLMANMEEGAMVAVIGQEEEKVRQLCQQAKIDQGVLEIANYNSPLQLIISGDIESVDNLLELGMEEGIRLVPLAVSGAFHSPLMKQAADRFELHLRHLPLHDACIPVVANVTGRPVTIGEEWRRLLVEQIHSPVLWEPTIRFLWNEGVRCFVEIGPKNVLSKLVGTIVPEAKVLHVEDMTSLQNSIEYINQ